MYGTTSVLHPRNKPKHVSNNSADLKLLVNSVPDIRNYDLHKNTTAILNPIQETTPDKQIEEAHDVRTPRPKVTKIETKVLASVEKQDTSESPMRAVTQPEIRIDAFRESNKDIVYSLKGADKNFNVRSS